MFKGTVHSIYIAPEKEAAMQSIESVRAVPTKDLEGLLTTNVTELSVDVFHKRSIQCS